MKYLTVEIVRGKEIEVKEYEGEIEELQRVIEKMKEADFSNATRVFYNVWDWDEHYEHGEIKRGGRK